MLILGGKGSGKTTWLCDKIRRDLKPRGSLLVWDPQDEYGEANVGEILDAYTTPRGLLRERRWPRRLAARFAACRDDDADIVAAIGWARPHSLIVWEEVQRLCPAGTPPKWLRDMVTTARHRALSLVFTSQRPAAVPKDLVANADTVVVFRLQYDDDRQALYRSLGDRRILETAGLAVGQHLLLEP